MNPFYFFFVACCAGLVQVAFLDRFRLFGAGPDLFMAATAVAAVCCNAPAALAVGLLNGLLKDALDPGPFGLNVLTFPFLAYVIARLNRTLSLENRLSCSLITALAVIAGGIVSLVALSCSGAGVPRGAMLRIVFLEAFLTAVCVPVLLAIVHSRRRLLG